MGSRRPGMFVESRRVAVVLDVAAGTAPTPRTAAAARGVTEVARRTRHRVWALGLLLGLAAVPARPETVLAQERVKAAVDDGARVPLPGHPLRALRLARETGRLKAETRLDHLLMVLQASPAQDHELQALLDQQLDRSST